MTTSSTPEFERAQAREAPEASAGALQLPNAEVGIPQGAVQVQVQPRGRAVGAIVSVLVPGVGSMINGSTARGVIILASYIVSWILCLVVIGFVLAPAVWIWGIVDGALSADRWNREHGIIS